MPPTPSTTFLPSLSFLPFQPFAPQSLENVTVRIELTRLRGLRLKEGDGNTELIM
jgi:hypothetical protein